MAKRKKLLPARKEQIKDDSLLIRSAESLGRVIGSLQRQVHGSSKRVSLLADEAINAVPDLPSFDMMFGASKRPARQRVVRAAKTRTASSSARRASTSRKQSRSRKSSKKR